MTSDWRWRVDDPAHNEGLGLLYEPGNPGDLIKALWLGSMVRALAQAGQPLHLLDCFAGAPSYPLVAGVRERLEAWQPPEWLSAVLAPHVAAGGWPSAATIAHDAAHQLGVPLTASIVDADDGRRSAWQERSWAQVSGATDGWQALSQPAAGRANLVLIDPYDLVRDGQPHLAAIRQTAASRPCLLYLYNRSPRGANHFRAYRQLREAFTSGLEWQLGRVASDAILPRAYHEMLLLGLPPSEPLAMETRRLHSYSLASGAYDSGGSPPDPGGSVRVG